MKNLSLGFAVFLGGMLLAVGFARAGNNDSIQPVKEGQTYRTFRVDLNSDGRPEQVVVKAYGVSGSDWFARVLVLDSSGKVIWRGPASKNTADPLVFGNFEYGYALPELIQDIDADGKVEMIAGSPVSDVRPQPFRIFRWTGSKFVYLRTRTLMESSAGSGQFVWSQPGPPQGCWISELKAGKAGQGILADVFEYVNNRTRGGKAELSATPSGFKVTRWVAPLKAFE